MRLRLVALAAALLSLTGAGAALALPAPHALPSSSPSYCDDLDPAQCLLPYPNDYFTRPDPTAATGRRLDLNLLAMPRNREGKPIEPAEWNRLDGFSPGSTLLAYVPGMTSNADLAPSKLPPVTDLARYADRDAGVVVIDTATGRRWPVWAEVDQYASSPSDRVLMVHPSVNFTAGHRYVVALRHLRRDDGSLAQPSAAFRAYRDGKAPRTDPRRAHMESIFRTLARAGVARHGLYLAWDFTVASRRSLTGRLLAMRDQSLALLGDTTPGDGRVQGRAPSFTVDQVTNYTPAQDPRIAREVTGHFTVPCFIAPSCTPGPGQFLLDPSNPDAVPHPVAGQTYQANFQCEVPRVALDRHRRVRPVEYGHGLFGSSSEVTADPQKDMANKFGMLYCATDWFGMAQADIPNAVLALQDLSRFPVLTDRVQQGELDFLMLARLMVHPHGLASNPAFQWPDGRSFIDTRQAFYDGNSQGGIYGGTVCAVSVDVRRCVLGVPGMDYSMLLPRSSDYVSSSGSVGYSTAYDLGYPDQAQRMLVLDLVQQLWDRSDPDGYAQWLGGGLPRTPAHHVLLQVAWGDHQVANITAFSEARTLGAVGLRPALVAGRYGPYADPLWGLPAPPAFPYDGSALVLFDTGPVRPAPGGGVTGTNWPPTADVPNRAGEDPHEASRRAACGQQQKAAFLDVGGLVTAPCGGAPYFAGGWDGRL